MPLPGSVTTVTVNGGYVRADGTVPSGTVTFRPSVRAFVAGTTVTIEPVTVALDAAGQFSVQLAWQDDLDLTPHGWTYEVIETVGGDSRRWWVKLPETGPVVLDSLAPVDEVEPTVVRVLSVNGELPDALGNVVVGAGAAPVQSVDGRTGAVVLGDLYVDPTELATGLAGKANASHTHAQADVTGLTAALTGKETAGAAAAAVAAHEAAGDPHPQYLTGPEGNAAYDPINAASSAMTAHTAAGDPHPQYLTAAEGSAAYAALAHTHSIANVTGLQTALDGKATKPTIRQAWILSGDINPLPNTAAAWQPLAGFELQLPAVVGDYVELSVNAMRKDIGGNAWLDQAVVTGAGPTIARYLSSGGATPGVEGDPGWYVPSGGIVGRSASRGFTVTAPDLDGGNVRFVMAVKSNGTGILYASTNYPFFWKAENKGAVS